MVFIQIRGKYKTIKERLFMKIIRTDRGRGKTTELIKQSARDRSYILCMNKENARYIYDMAREMNLNIPYPITTADLPLRGFKGSVLIDEIDYILPRLIGTQVDVITTSAPIDTLDDKNITLKIKAEIDNFDDVKQKIKELQDELDSLKISISI